MKFREFKGNKYLCDLDRNRSGYFLLGKMVFDHIGYELSVSVFLDSWMRSDGSACYELYLL
jgi:hypothetical protein